MDINDFENRFRRIQQEIEDDRKRARQWAWVSTFINFSVLLFFLWVIVKTMQWLGII